MAVIRICRSLQREAMSRDFRRRDPSSGDQIDERLEVSLFSPSHVFDAEGLDRAPRTRRHIGRDVRTGKTKLEFLLVEERRLAATGTSPTMTTRPRSRRR